MAALGSTSLYYSLPSLSSILPRIYVTLLHSTMSLLCSTSLYFTLAWFHLALLYSTTLYHGSSWLYITLLLSTMSVFHSTMDLRDSTTSYHVTPQYFYTIPTSCAILPKLCDCICFLVECRRGLSCRWKGVAWVCCA